MRIFISLLTVLILAAGSIAAPVMAIPSENTLPANRIIIADDLQIAPPLVRQDQSYAPRRDDIIGETMQVGDTYYDYQSNGNIGKMIALDNGGNIHVTWMDGYTIQNAGERRQVYNFLAVDSEDWDHGGGVPIEDGDRSGYGCLTLCESDEDGQRAICFFHATGGSFPDDATWISAIDYGIGWGAFTSTDFPTYPDGASVAWPRGVMSVENGSIHVVGNDLGGEDNVPGRISYMLSHLQDDAVVADLEMPREAGETHLNTYQIARSPVSDKVVIVFPNTRTENPAPPEWEGFAAWQMNNDLFMVWSDDGENWNFDDPYNITDCIMPDRTLDDPECYGDTLLPYCTFDVIIDEDDVTHVVFEVRGLWWDPNWSAEDNDPPPLRSDDDWVNYPGLTTDASYLFHWDEESLEFNVVADGWFRHFVVVDDTIRAIPTPGAWKSNVCYPSLTFADNGNLYCAYNYYPENDFNDYIGDYGRCNGDIAITVSDDNGQTWYEPTHVVQTRTHLPEPGDADCEIYPSLSDRIDDFLHLFYIVDKEAGTEIQASDAGAANTLNPVIYQKISVDDILMEEELADMPSFHVGDDEDPGAVNQQTHWTPSGFRLTGAYPNPFNSTTSIEFDVKQQQNVTLEAFNINGQKVAELFAGEVLAGHHRMNWEASDLTAGVYVIRLTSAESIAAIKVALVK